MPSRLKRPCRHPGCPRLSHARFCDEHRRLANRLTSSRRGDSTQRGYDAAWQKLRAWYIREHPFCEDCLEQGVFTTWRVEVDHIIPISVRPDLRLDPDNLRTRCQYHHKRKTAEDRRRYGLKTSGQAPQHVGDIPMSLELSERDPPPVLKCLQETT